MADNAVTETHAERPATTDDTTEALIDAEKTFKMTAIGALLFCLASLFIIMRTRMG